MGQKVNPNTFRLGINKTWKTSFFEKKNKELRECIFEDLEITYYIKRFFRMQGLQIHDYKVYYSETSVNISIHYFVASSIFSQENPKTFQNDLPKVLTSNKFKKIPAIGANNGVLGLKKKHHCLNKNFKSIFNYRNKIFTKFVTKRNFKNNSGLKFSLKRKLFLLPNIFTERLNSDLRSFLVTLSYFLKSKHEVKLTLRCTNNNLILTPRETNNFKKNFMFLQKFKHLQNFHELTNICFMCLTNHNCSELLAHRISKELKTIKRHKPLIKFLNRFFNSFIKTNFSKILGLKILIKGRLNSAPRAKSKIINIGSVPIQKITANIDFAQTTISNFNGSYGVKVWISY